MISSTLDDSFDRTPMTTGNEAVQCLTREETSGIRVGRNQFFQIDPILLASIDIFQRDPDIDDIEYLVSASAQLNWILEVNLGKQDCIIINE